MLPQNQNTQEQIKVYHIEDLKTEIKNLKSQQELKIVFNDIQMNFLYTDIPLYLLYDNCKSLNLNLKGFLSCQIDFDDFVQVFQCFKNLTNLKLRFYNKRVQNLDSLLANIQNIENVNLNLKCFRNIKLEKQFTQSQKIKFLSLNLSNTTFHSEQDEQKLMEFISNLDNLEELQLKIKKQNQFKFMLIKNREIKITLDLYNNNINLQFCDSLVEFIKHNDLQDIVEVEKIKQIFSVYLEDKGIKMTYPYQFSSGIQINLFQQNDFKRLKQIPIFAQKIIDLKKQDENFCLNIYGNNTQQSDCFKYLIPQIDHHFDSINCHFVNITNKTMNQWFISINGPNLNLVPGLVNVTLFINYYLNPQIVIETIKYLKQSEYLISLQLKDRIISYGQNWNETLKKLQNMLLNCIQTQINIVSEKSLIKLRYFAFKKNIFDLIPIPDQIFYDLIEI